MDNDNYYASIVSVPLPLPQIQILILCIFLFLVIEKFSKFISNRKLVVDMELQQIKSEQDQCMIISLKDNLEKQKEEYIRDLTRLYEKYNALEAEVQRRMNEMNEK